MDDRRTFLKSLALLAAAGPGGLSAAGAQQTAAPPTAKPSPGNPATLKKSTLISMLPKGTYADRFAIGREAGFEAVEMQTITDEAAAAEIKEASTKTGLRIHSVMNSEHWRSPISSSDSEVVNRSVKGMETSLKNAALWGADAVLLVPAVVDAATSYRDAWTRSQRVIRERLLPMAKDLKVIIAVEEVWNKFLLSPLEFARYVDDFESPWLKAYFDVGNVVITGYPQDWIRTLGSRIVKIHLKDFVMDRKSRTFEFKNLGEGEIDWPEVRKALGEVGYSGYITTEIQGGDLTYLKDVSARVDRIIAGQKPVPAASSAAGAK
jgi:L-ribulose-5-phosphate 3-epimerase